MSKTENKKLEPGWWKPYWIVLVIATIVIGLTLPIFSHIPLESAIIYTVLALIAEGIAYYGRVRPSIRLNRVMYILIGVPVGFVLWYISWFFVLRPMFPRAGQDTLALLSLAVCFGIGAFIGELIGRIRHYKGPEQYQP